MVTASKKHGNDKRRIPAESVAIGLKTGVRVKTLGKVQKIGVNLEAVGNNFVKINK